MNKLAKFALTSAVALVLGSPLALAEDAPAAKPQVSQAAGKDLQAANKALQAKQYDEALAALERLKAVQKKNEYDEYLINEFTFSAYAGQKKYEEAEAPLEAAMTSKYMPPDELKQRLGQAATLAYQLKHYDKAIEYGTRAAKDGGDTTGQMQAIVAQAYYVQNDYKNTDRVVREAVEQEVKAGQTPTEDMLMLGYSASSKLKDQAGIDRWLEQLVAYHPKPEYWQNVLESIYDAHPPDRLQLQVYRLSLDVGALKTGQEYAEMAQLALDAGSPGEAVSVLNKALAANAFVDAATKNRNTHLLETAKKQAAADEPTLAKSEAEGTAAATGDKLVGAGIGYFGYGQYDKAAKDISAGLAKGMAKDSTDARLILGISQLRAGDKDSAVKTFNAVKGDPVAEHLAALWVLRAKSA